MMNRTVCYLFSCFIYCRLGLSNHVAPEMCTKPKGSPGKQKPGPNYGAYSKVYYTFSTSSSYCSRQDSISPTSTGNPIVAPTCCSFIGASSFIYDVPTAASTAEPSADYYEETIEPTQGRTRPGTDVSDSSIPPSAEPSQVATNSKGGLPTIDVPSILGIMPTHSPKFYPPSQRYPTRLDREHDRQLSLHEENEDVARLLSSSDSSPYSHSMSANTFVMSLSAVLCLLLYR